MHLREVSSGPTKIQKNVPEAKVSKWVGALIQQSTLRKEGGESLAGTTTITDEAVVEAAAVAVDESFVGVAAVAVKRPQFESPFSRKM